MRCEICGTEYRKIESSLICSNGHTLQNMQEVAHEDPHLVALKTKKIRRVKKEKKIFLGTGCYLTRMILMKLLFEEAREFFKFPNDKVFKYFTGFFEFKKTKLESGFNVSKREFFALIYLNRRSEMEKVGKTYFLKDCRSDFKELDIYTRLILIKNKYPPLESACYEFSKTVLYISIENLKNRILDLINPCTDMNSFIGSRASETGVLLSSIEISRQNIRRMFRNDIAIAKLYFKALCEQYGLKITEELDFYFEKFFYTFDHEQVFIPEYDFVLFIAAYFISIKKFEDTELETKIFTDFNCTKITFVKKMSDFFKTLEYCISPETFIVKMNDNNSKRFKALSRSVEFIDAFKRKIARKKLGKNFKDKDNIEAGDRA